MNCNTCGLPGNHLFASNCVDALRSALASAESKLGRRSWQPIATAPKDERIIIAKIAESIGKWAGDVGLEPHVWFAVTATHNGRYWTDGVERLIEPTHWMELPEVPQ